MNEKSSCPVLRGRDGGNTILLLDHTGEALLASGYTYRTLYPDLSLLKRAASELAGREERFPFFSPAVILDPELSRRLKELHHALATAQSPKEHSRWCGWEA